MAETAKYMLENDFGCGLVGAIFQRRSSKASKALVRPLPSNRDNNTIKKPSIQNPKRERSVSGDAAILDSSESAKPPPKLDEKLVTTPTLVNPRPSNAARSSKSSSPYSSGLTKVSEAPADSRKLRREPTFTSSELSMTVFNPRSNVTSASYPASSGNVMPLGHLGNLKQLGTKSSLANNSPNITPGTLDYRHRTMQRTGNGKIGGTVGNIVRRPSGSMNKLDPEALKLIGNEEYKKGRFEEALALYNQAIALDSSKASCYSNKSAALICLGRLVEAVFECKEAIRIEPCYQRAHLRLARLYLRLGEAEKALDHYIQSGPKADSNDIAQAQALIKHLSRCNEARELRDWNTLLKESLCAVSSGADSSPQIYAMQAEALLKLHRHQEACDTIRMEPKFQIESLAQLFGSATSAYLLIIRAQIYMVDGRFEDAVAVGQLAAWLDSSNEVNAAVRRLREMASARANGNQLFKASKFTEASIAYSEGLDHDPYNSILLCNLAACRSKLGQFEKAIEDCTAALNVRPSYSKARLRRADCNAKLERWEAAIQDYETLIRETPGDEEVGKALFEAQVNLKKQHGEDTKDLKLSSNLVLISSSEHFKHLGCLLCSSATKCATSKCCSSWSKFGRDTNLSTSSRWRLKTTPT
ncbi:inactive TPR repeat-containing thioredoxin TTL3-like isoform X2 [Cornus florida]|uniref:inactive TPR repeat-containing thioredoxin TTL3-like isoform X2 n=1 Tax=Cornus florida TaxID=4283 RepID=UPI0028996280|nr:inactive TPR repeat-containing thioredoxin TTL3-like isoform X2 [Cornus florida]